jgi:hypothetical protein
MAKAKAKARKAPSSLAELQAWMGTAISRPLPDAYQGNPLAVSMPELEGEAEALVRGKGDLSGFGRVGIYNQQYWFRLISIMQSEYPCAVHLMGLHAFNDWAVRYLVAHPPASPFLAELDARFPAYLEEEYQGERREAVLQAAAYDRALSKAFDAPGGKALADAGAAGPAEWVSLKLILAPHVTPLRVDWDFPDYRAQCAPDESLEGRFELKAGTAHFVIFRDVDPEVMRQPVPAPALAVLEAFREPATLAEAFEKLEGRLSPEAQTELAAGLSGWFQEWVERGWLCVAGAEPTI